MATIARLLHDHPLTAQQAARYLEVSPGHLYNLVCRGGAPRHIKYRRQLRFRRSDLDTWVTHRVHAFTDPWSHPAAPTADNRPVLG
jgi:excisionase family DNA binding protein